MVEADKKQMYYVIYVQKGKDAGRAASPGPPDLIDNEEEYEIEQILKHRGPPKNRSYLIRWKGYTAEEDAWLKEAKLGNTTEFLYAYKKRIKISPKRKT